MSIEIVWLTFPTVAVIVSLPVLPEIDANVALAWPLASVVALEVTFPRAMSLRTNVTAIPEPNGLPA